MKFSQFAGTSIVPTLSRIVLALAFVTVGYNKLMRDVEYSTVQAETLRTLGVTVVKIADPAAGAAAAVDGPRIVLASLQETPEEAKEEAEGTAATADPATADPATAEPEDTTQDEPREETAAPAKPPAADPVVAPPAEVPAVTPTAPPLDDDARYTARGVHKITLMVHGHSWPIPKTMAYVAGITELLGGALVLVGFLTRIWALGLAITMGVAFYFVSMGFNGILDVTPFDFATDIGRYNTAVSQVGLFALSFGLLLTGAGPLSLDRMLFGRGGGRKKTSVLDDFDEADSGPSARPM